MDTFVNPLKNSVRNVSNMVKSMPDNFADGVAKMSGGIKSIPSNMLDSVGKVLNVKGVSSLSISHIFCEEEEHSNELENMRGLYGLLSSAGFIFRSL